MENWIFLSSKVKHLYIINDMECACDYRWQGQTSRDLNSSWTELEVYFLCEAFVFTLFWLNVHMGLSLYFFCCFLYKNFLIVIVTPCCIIKGVFLVATKLYHVTKFLFTNGCIFAFWEADPTHDHLLLNCLYLVFIFLIFLACIFGNRSWNET